IEEIRQMLPDGFTLQSAADIGFIDDVEETGKTFEANAELKARALFEFANEPALADDSGLEVKTLNGQPGVRSARFAGEPVNHEKNVELLLSKLEGNADRSARFVTVLCLITQDKTFFFEGEVKGVIGTEIKGKGGFGYDPVFIPEGHTRTFAEMSAEEKNSMSHRRDSLNKLLDLLTYI